MESGRLLLSKSRVNWHQPEATYFVERLIVEELSVSARKEKAIKKEAVNGHAK